MAFPNLSGGMVSIRAHRLRWKATLRIPKALEDHYGTKYQYRNLASPDRRAAKLEADAWELALRLEWAQMLGGAPAPAYAALRDLYARVRERAESGAFRMQGDPDDPDETTAGIGWEIGALADKYEDDAEPSDEDRFKLMALNDAKANLEGRKVPERKELQLTFRELATEYLKIWRTDRGLKESNTEQQKVATFDLFGGYWGARPIREVRKKDAAEFVDALRQMDPLWARSAKSRGMSWAQLQRAYGGKPQGLSDGTINRHLATLQSLWTWAEDRDHCDGKNPFTGFHRRLKDGRNVKGYQAWEPAELRSLFDPPPKRSDVTEIMLVAMFTGMRLDEIASLTRGQIMREGKVSFVQVVDAKTEAGVRRVPLHPKLQWLADRAKGAAAERVWPAFNPEGPGKKAGADAGKEFSRFKLGKGFASRRKAFHSFRKNFVGQLEERGVPQSEVAQLVGHEKGFTFGKYGTTVTLARMAKIVAMIDYAGLSLPEPATPPE